MKLLFSEHKSDYAHYIFPYAIWAIPEPGEPPSDLFNAGFLPSSRELDHFYLCRHVRVQLPKYQPSSENRRILRKGEDVTATLVPRAEFDYTAARREFFRQYADAKFGQGKMTLERLDSLFNSRITTHLLIFQENESKREVGVVTLYLEPKRMAYYYYAFYDLAWHERSLGMHMMTSAMEHFAREGFEFLYLGSCYSQNALYKTQFGGAEFFNGVHWSANLDELKYLIQREGGEIRQHLLETEEYRKLFAEGGLDALVARSRFRLKP